MLLSKNNIKEFTQAVRQLTEEMRKNVRPYEFTTNITTPLQWQEILRKRRANAENRRNQLISQIPKFKNMQQFIVENRLVLSKFNNGHFRLQNPNTRKFVDWWETKKKKMRNIDGSYGFQGKDKCFLLQEIAKLV